MSSLLQLVFLCFMIGCASATPQTDVLLSRQRRGPPAQLIVGVPFVEQTTGHCGPATLTMALRWAGKSVSVEEVASQVYTPGMKGSLQSDMISASRRRGMMALPVVGFEALLQEIDAGHPVIVFENLSVSWYPQWHYAIVFGYDLLAQKIVMHSGPEAYKSWDLRKFERSWRLGDYWGLVVLRPDQLSASANELAHVSAAASLEQIGKIEEANTAYQRILERWPQSLVAHVGLANVAYTRGEYKRAAVILRQASVTHPESAIVWHNLVFALAASGCPQEAHQSAVEALRHVAPESRANYVDSLREWLR